MVILLSTPDLQTTVYPNIAMTTQDIHTMLKQHLLNGRKTLMWFNCLFLFVVVVFLNCSSSSTLGNRGCFAGKPDIQNYGSSPLNKDYHVCFWMSRKPFYCRTRQLTWHMCAGWRLIETPWHIEEAQCPAVASVKSSRWRISLAKWPVLHCSLTGQLDCIIILSESSRHVVVHLWLHMVPWTHKQQIFILINFAFFFFFIRKCFLYDYVPYNFRV
jgi:hypothetical protein